MGLLKVLPLLRLVIPDLEIYWVYGFTLGIQIGGLETNTDPLVKEWLSLVKKLISETEGFHDVGRLSGIVVTRAKHAAFAIFGLFFAPKGAAG